MSIAGAAPIAPAKPKATRRFTCAEVWGGNRPIDSSVNLAGVRGHVYSQPCDGGRGGDVHYVSICGSGLISRFCLADVAGHGERVGLVSEQLHRLLDRYMDNSDQRRVLADLNTRLVTSDSSVLTTAAMMTYFPPTRRLSISYAGHPPAWLYRRREERWEPLMLELPPHKENDMLNLPLAIQPRISFTRKTLRVRPGDRLVLVTDGVLEAPAPGGELFGQARLEELLRRGRNAGVGELKDEILGALAAHTGKGTLTHDDVTLMVLEIVPGPPAMGMWHVLKNRLRGRRKSD